jgi:hypothetical protein
MNESFSYPQLEAAMRQLHNVPAARSGTFKARIRNFQRIGLIPSAPGKGQRIDYSIVDAVTWALCFEFAEVGLLPENIKAIFNLIGLGLYLPFGGPIEDEDRILILRGNFLEWYLAGAGDQLGGEGETSFGIILVSQVYDMVFKKAAIPRVIMINLTDLKRKLGDALKIEWDDYSVYIPDRDSGVVMSRSVSRGAAASK